MPFGLRPRREGAPTAGAASPGDRGELPIALVLGLGNPGAEYAGNRHNVGFWVVNRLARRLGIEISRHTKVASVGEGEEAGRPLILAKPRTYMNESGRAAAELLRRYSLQPRQMLVVCDDIDSPVGRVRVRADGGYGGQKGLRSIIETLKTQEFPRVRIGIGRPTRGGQPSWDPEDVSAWVLSDPSPAEKRVLDEAVDYAIEVVLCCLREGVAEAMNRYNGRSPGDAPRAATAARREGEGL
jgi:PTH1 family peptidyl-tRNA hydrolase